MKFLKSSCLLLASVAFLASCKSGKNPTDTAAKYVPKSAAMVLSVDLAKLAENKLTLSKVSEWTKSKEIQQKAIESGVDTSSRVFGFVSLAGDDIDDGMGGVIFKIADNEKYKAYIAGLGEVKEENGITFLENEKYFTASNGSFGLFLTGNPSFDLKTEGLTIFASKTEETVLGDETNMFSDQQSSSYDLAFWINGYEFSKLSTMEEEAALVMSTLHLNEYFSSTTLSFEAGEIVMESKTSGSDEFKTTYNSFVPGNGVETSTSEVLNGENLSGYAGLKIDPKGFEKVAAIGEFKPMVDEMLSKTGLELSDILGALTGDIAVSLNGMTGVEQEKIDYNAYLYDEELDEDAEPEVRVVTKQMPDFTLAMGIQDQEKLDKLMNIALMALQGELEKTGEGTYVNKETGMTFFEKNGNMILAFKPTMDKLKEGKVNAPGSDVVSNMSSYPAYYYFDLVKFMEQLSAASPEAAMGIGMGKQYIPFTAIEGYSTADQNYSSKLVIKMEDETKNSLVQVVEKVDQFMNGIGKMMNGMM